MTTTTDLRVPMCPVCHHPLGMHDQITDTKWSCDEDACEDRDGCRLRIEVTSLEPLPCKKCGVPVIYASQHLVGGRDPGWTCQR